MPFYFDIPDVLALDYMIFQISDGDPTKYHYIEKHYDVDDFYLWVAFKNRDNKAQDYLMNKK